MVNMIPQQAHCRIRTTVARYYRRVGLQQALAVSA